MMCSVSISTGFPQLDILINGYEKGKVYLFSGRPSMGKSIFAVNIAKNVAINQHKNVLVFYLEGSKERFVQRLITAQSFVDITRFNTGTLSDDELEKLSRNIENIAYANINIDNSPELTLDVLREKIQTCRNTDLVIIDYLQLAQVDGNRKKANSDFLLSVRKIAKEKNIAIIIISSLSSNCERRVDKRPILRDLQEDGVLEQLAAVVLFLYRDEIYYPSTEKKNITEIIVARNREGSTGIVEVVFIPKVNLIANLEVNIP